MRGTGMPVFSRDAVLSAVVTPPLLIAFRVDASSLIGSGHVMRCLSLAMVLLKRGASVVMISRALPVALNNLCESRGVRVLNLPTSPGADLAGRLIQGNANLAIQQADADATIQLLGKSRASWMVVDHYGIDHQWHSILRPHVGRIAVIDDLADRNHDCDLLIDANLLANSERRYVGRTSGVSRFCTGPRYAMLRPEFAQKAQETKRDFRKIRRILVTFGGFDVANHTKLALQALEYIGFSGAVDVVVAAGHPDLQELTALADRHSRWTVHIQAANMAELMASADFAIGAGGTTTYERACLGLPSLAICAAENQRAQLQHAAAAGILTNYPAERLSVEHLSQAILNHIGSPERLMAQSQKGQHLVDGRGAERVVKVLLADGPITVRPATPLDAMTVLDWRNAEVVRKFSGDSALIPAASHADWFAKRLASEACVMLIGQCRGEDCGTVRFDIEDETATVSIFLSPSFMGRGIGLGLLLIAERHLVNRSPEVKVCVARVSPANIASQAMFSAAGYDQAEGQWSKRI
jgi:UDP-2,4-diacetamido-2,4,6-trideoxy-beta-L-altropyranose hydrolase